MDPVDVLAWFLVIVAAPRIARRPWTWWHVLALWMLACGMATTLQQHLVTAAPFWLHLRDAALRWFGSWSAQEPLYPLRAAGTMMIGPLIFLAVRRTAREMDRHRALSLLTYGTALSLAIGLFQFITRTGAGEHWVRFNPDLFRISGTGPDPNAFGAFIALMMPLLAVQAFRAKGSLRWIAATGCALSLPNLIWTASRSAWTGTVAAAACVLLIWLIGHARLPEVKRGMLAGGFCLVTVATLVIPLTNNGVSSKPTSYWELFIATLQPERPLNERLHGRLPLWNAGFSMVGTAPLTGLGPGEYPRQLADHLPIPLPDFMQHENAHNYFIQIAAEAGLIGLALFLVSVGLAVRAALHGSAYGVAAAAGTLAFFVASAGSHPLLVVQLQCVFWAYLALGAPTCDAVRRSRKALLPLLSLPVLLLPIGMNGLRPRMPSGEYAHGVHAWEGSGPFRTRWTAREATISLSRHGTYLEIPMLTFAPQDGSQPIVASVDIDGREHRVELLSGRLERPIFPLPNDGSQRLTIKLWTATTFVPRELEMSSDPRELGIRLGPFVWHGIECAAGPTVWPPWLPRAYLGLPYRLELWPSCGSPPYRVTISGELPPGLSYDIERRMIHGTPRTLGAYPFSFVATDEAGRGETITKEYALDIELGGEGLARDLEFLPGSEGYYVLDGLGRIHPGGGAPVLVPPPKPLDADLARDLELDSSRHGAYILDAFGGIHIAGSSASLAPSTPYWGWDIARALKLTADGTGYLVLDGLGGVWAGGSAKIPSPRTPYFGVDVARDIEPLPDGTGYYVLDALGGVHRGGSAPAAHPGTPYFGFPIARDLELGWTAGDYYVLDGYGGVHSSKGELPSAFGPQPYVLHDVMRDLELTPDGKGFFLLDVYGNLHTAGSAVLREPRTPTFP